MPNVRDYIAKRIAENQDALDDAREKRSQGQALAGMTEGLGQAIAGISGGSDFKPQDYKSLHEQADLPMEDYAAKQKAKAQATDQAVKEEELQTKADAVDANSPRSKMVHAVLTKYNPKLANTEFAAADAPMIQHLESTRENAEMRKELMRGRLDQQAAVNQQKADSELGTRLSQLGSRGGNAKYVDAIRRSENIQRLLDQYPDLNKMPKNQVNLLFSEIDSMVNGGAPTHSGTTMIIPQAKRAQLEQWLSEWENKPHGAELGQFLEQDTVPYVRDISENARQHMLSEHNKLIDSYKARLAADAYQRHKEEAANTYRAPAPRVKPSPVGPYNDPKKEARYQEWKRKQGM